MLFQAEPKSSSDTVTLEKLKDKLVAIGIPENQIAIKTSNVNELKGVNLLSTDCEIRYIITVNALKEGWDCPFAYILASVANKTSRVDVEQILGRILRQPYAKKHKMPLLNTSYVLTSSRDFRTTLDDIVVGLNKAGFSKKDYRIGEIEKTPFAPNEGEQLKNDDSKDKLALGKKWDYMCGSKFKYYMVFEHKNMEIQGSYTMDRFIEILKNL